ncbi:hypothetical protein PRUPE_4G228800 [Prunus persica]|uniref:Uncharacterized protein n=2 Tax=Prunus persica TaxID=3760 RepID=A0A251PPN4_PRUPE|nr:hypothetical protein PRUPE_4G228800 [Prunus persica]
MKSCGEFLGRTWNIQDVFTLGVILALHSLCAFAPFHFNWPAFWVAVTLYVVTALGITLCYHRTLTHRGLRLPKWLEYLFAYCGVLSLQGVRTVLLFDATLIINSVGHMWGKKPWNTGDMSTNNWWMSIITLGEGWHNNHHAFEYSARHGLEWWQIDITWYVIRFLQAIGLATDVKVPTEIQKQRKASNGRIMATQK